MKADHTAGGLQTKNEQGSALKEEQNQNKHLQTPQDYILVTFDIKKTQGLNPTTPASLPAAQNFLAAEQKLSGT